MSVEQEDGTNAVDVVEEQPQVEVEQPQEEAPPDPEEKPQDEPDGEVEVSFGDAPVAPKPVEEQKAQDNSTIRQMRQRIRELESKVKQEPPEAPKLGPKPTLADHDYDEEKFEAALVAWADQKRKVEAEAKTAQERQQKAVEVFQGKVSAYAQAKEALRVADFADAEETVAGTLSVVQQNIILAHAEAPEKLVYALGKDEKRLKELSEVQDPLEFVKKMTQLEGKLTVANKSKSPPPPDRKITGGSGPVSSDTTLRRLEEEADRTGDRTKVVAYKRQQRLKGK